MIALVTGYILDLMIGDPHGIPHPVTAIGKLIAHLEKRLRKRADGDAKREINCGIVMCVIVLLAVIMSTIAVIALAYYVNRYAGMITEAILTCYILAAKSLSKESMKVHDDLIRDDITAARFDLSMIVGRDTDRLDRDGIIRAAVETVAENTSDGVMAPLLYTAIGGPILGLMYKAVNTMDSMVGYRDERYEYFGKAAARLDDVFNFLPSRISALYIIMASGVTGFDPGSAFRIWKRDRRNHKSPNSAQTESACAGALGVRLGGENYYRGVLVSKPYIGDDTRAIETEDIPRAGRLMFVGEAFLMITVLIMVYIIVFVM